MYECDGPRQPRRLRQAWQALPAARELVLKPMEAVKTLAYFDEGEAVNVPPATRRYLTRQVAAWDCTVSRIDRAAASVAARRRG